ncbi:MAG: hypothetical protein ACKO0W_03530 [Planctomycetota bacterium]
MNLRLALASTVLAAASTQLASSAVIVFAAESLWSSYTTAGGFGIVTEDFSGYSGFYASGLAGTTTGAAGTVNWNASASGGLFAAAGLFSTNNIAPLSFDFSSSQVRAVGGNFFSTDINFNFVTSIIQVSLNDGTSYFGSIDSAADFVGFYSTSALISSITITAIPVPGGEQSVYPTVDNLSWGIVPAPGAIALLGLAGLAGRRRR